MIEDDLTTRLRYLTPDRDCRKKEPHENSTWSVLEVSVRHTLSQTRKLAWDNIPVSYLEGRFGTSEQKTYLRSCLFVRPLSDDIERLGASDAYSR